MALSQILRQECKQCGKIAVEDSRIKLGVTTIIRLACGHILHSTSDVSSNEEVYNNLAFSDGKKPRPYQIECIKFIEESGFRCIVADEQGLGKTIEFACALRLHPEKLLPAVFVVPTTVKLQWMWEILRICAPQGTNEQKRQFLTQVIQSGKEKAMPGFQIYLTTFDMLKKDDVFEYVPEINTMMIDECQRIKNHLSDRAKACQKLAKRVKYIIPMSGTPIKNNAGEYYTVLNLVAPARFPQYQRYIDTYCDAYNNGWTQKIGGLKDADRFYEDTKDIIIRRTKSEVLKDLPSIERKFYHVELDRKLNKAYAAALKELDDMLYSDESEFAKTTQTIAIMSKLRHITGISKVAECIEFVTEFLLSTERKIVIFSHHQDVMELLVNNLDVWLKDGGYGNVCKMHSGLDGNARAALVEKFKSDNLARVMCASTLAAGEGLNLQFCSDAILLERQWNPANEEQVEARFHRFGQENNVSVTYMIASGTIDEYFTELVEIKRSIVASALDKKEMQWEQNSLMKDLALILTTKGRDKWRM